MTKEDFILFITKLGFGKTWTTIENRYNILISEYDFSLINIELHNDDCVYLSYSKINSNISIGQKIGEFNLSILDKFEFIRIILPFFKKIPDNFKSYIRDEKINNLLK